MICTSHKIPFGWSDQDQMGGVCGTYSGEERCVQGFGGVNLQEKATWKTQMQMGGKY